MTLLQPEIIYGELFKEVALQRVFPDGKTFVDCVSDSSPAELLQLYEEQRLEEDFNLREFIKRHFYLPQHKQDDFVSDNTLAIEDHIEKLWEVLERSPSSKSCGSLIALPHKTIIPGGRFREMYYWDSYFTMLGLEVSGKHGLIREMVDNFAWQIEQFGYIPNGTRGYFLGRSQPPFFASMLRILERCFPKESILGHYLPVLEKEYAYWMKGAEKLSGPGASLHVVRLADGAILNRFFDENETPRVEMYAEDVELAAASGRKPREFYRHIRAACESGWDFSCRWFADGISLKTVNCANLIPPDLNALLFNMENTLAEAYQMSGESSKSVEILGAAESRRIAMDSVCWSAGEGVYRDFDYAEKKQTGVLSLATVSPLYFKMSSEEQASKVADIIEKRFLQPGGLPCSLVESGEQWDWPNGWAPLQWLAIVGLRNYGHHELANEIKERWISLNIKVYKETGKLVEKYNVVNIDAEGGGGEYPLQDGFGWTNGVLLKLLTEEG